MIVTFLDKHGDYVHSYTDCQEIRDELVEGKLLKIKGTEYTIAKVETKINGSVSRIVHLL